MQTEQDLLNEVSRTAEKFAARHIAPILSESDHDMHGFPAEAFSLGVEAGFDRLVLPEDAGGHGFDDTALCALITKMSRTCAGHAMVFGVHAAILKTLHEQGAGALVEKVLESGKPAGAAIPAPGDGAAPFCTVSAAIEGESISLNGEAGAAVNVVKGGHTVVFADAGESGPLVLLIDNSGKEQAAAEPALGLRAMQIAELDVDGKSFDKTCVVAEGDGAAKFYRILVKNLCMVVSAAAAGVMAEAVKQARDYAEVRYQGGKMIIEHGHLRSILGEMAANSAASGRMAMSAAGGCDFKEALSIKRLVTDRAVQTCTDAVQVLGGYGYMREYGLEKMMRDTAVLSLLPISNDVCDLMMV